MMKKEFREHVLGDAGEVAGSCDVEADDYFVSIITCPYEGHAQFHVSVAKRLLEVLPRAIAHVESADRYKANASAETPGVCG